MATMGLAPIYQRPRTTVPHPAHLSTIALFDGSAITKFDVLPASASRLL
jgi:hypothetical protein